MSYGSSSLSGYVSIFYLTIKTKTYRIPDRFQSGSSEYRKRRSARGAADGLLGTVPECIQRVEGQEFLSFGRERAFVSSFACDLIDTDEHDVVCWLLCVYYTLDRRIRRLTYAVQTSHILQTGSTNIQVST